MWTNPYHELLKVKLKNSLTKSFFLNKDINMFIKQVSEFEIIMKIWTVAIYLAGRLGQNQEQVCVLHVEITIW